MRYQVPLSTRIKAGGVVLLVMLWALLTIGALVSPVVYVVFRVHSYTFNS